MPSDCKQQHHWGMQVELEARVVQSSKLDLLGWCKRAYNSMVLVTYSMVAIALNDLSNCHSFAEGWFHAMQGWNAAKGDDCVKVYDW